MKFDDYSEKEAIRHFRELVFQLHNLLRCDPDLKWEPLHNGENDAPSHLDLILDERRVSFETVYELKPSVPWVESFDPVGRQLLITPRITPRVLSACKERKLSVLDLNGRAWLRAEGLLVDRGALPGRSFSFSDEPRNIFTGKSERISRCLLTARERIWTQKELVERTGASSGLVSRIVNHLINQGIIDKTSSREFRLSEPEALLNNWAAADQLSERADTYTYAGFIKPAAEFVQDLKQWAHENGVEIAFTQWLAAWARRPFTEPVVCSAYVRRLPDSASLERLGLRRVTEGGKLWLHIPKDEGVFLEKRILPENSLPVVSDAQIYLDLQRTGLRGPEAADHLHEWENFCQP